MASPDQKSRAHAKLHGELGQLQFLFELAEAVSRAQKPGEIYRAAVRGLVRVLGADRSGVLVFDQYGVMRFQAWIGLSNEYRQAVEGHTPWRQGTRDARPIAVPDVTRDDSLADFQSAFAREGIRAVAFIPLLGKAGLIGKFMLYYDTPHEFQTEELQLAQMIAAHVAFAAERSNAEIALRESEERFRATFFQAAVGIAQVGLTLEWQLVNDRFCEILGYTQAELRKRTLLDITHPDDRESCLAALRSLLAGEMPSHTIEKRYLRRDGSIVWASVYVSLVRDPDNTPRYFIGVIEDITERKRAESALRESEERFRNMADTAPVMIWVTDSDGLCTFFNTRWLDFTGRAMEQELGTGWMEGVHPEDLDEAIATYISAFRGRHSFQMEQRLRRADGVYRRLLCTGVPRFTDGEVFAGYVGCSIDITDLKRSQEQLLATQKLESLGVLAGGIAHDFNNLLGSILADSELLLSDSATRRHTRDGVERIRAVATRASEIVRELMAYAGQENALFEPVDISRLVDEMLQLLKVSISKRATLKVNLAKNLPPASVNAPQIRQVVMNLITNASEALGENEGQITVTTSLTQIPADNPRHLPEGDYLCLEVQDTGCGMTEEVKAKIFDPFFTTKFAGRGLGLAAVQGIIRSHGGAFAVASALGQGSRFEILLPCVPQPARAGGEAAASAAAGELQGVSGSVLLVEDESTLRLAVSKMLRKKRFEVIEAGDGRAALDLFRARKQDIDVVLLDMTLPGMSGREVLEELRRIRPDVTVVLTTAYSQDTALTALGGRQSWLYIRKPYQLSELTRLLQKACLHRRGASGGPGSHQLP
jgi:two-component system cell cycle sensor histidine kinase/response regulator CckA